VMSGAVPAKSVPSLLKGEGATVLHCLRITRDQSLQPGAIGLRMIDNSWGIALTDLQRHQVPTPDLYVWNQYAIRGQAYPSQQRALARTQLAAPEPRSVPNGRIHGRSLVLQGR